MKRKINAKLREKPIISAFLGAIIIGLICLIIYILNYYTTEFNTIPNMELVSNIGSNVQISPIRYSYNYKGENFSLDENFDVNNYDYSACTIYKEAFNTTPEMKVVGNYKITNAFVNTYLYNPETHKYEEYESSKVYPYENKIRVSPEVSDGVENTYVFVYKIIYGKQGTAEYVVKLIENGHYNLGVLREYKEEDSIEELVKKLNFGRFFEKIEVIENKINLIYKYDIPEESKDANAIALFLLKDNIEEINFYHLNTKFARMENLKKIEFESTESTTIKKADLVEKFSLDLENLKKSIGL